MTDSVLIVGASVAGVGVLNELRRLGFSGEITLIDSEPEYPYDRPPLSKSVLYGDPAIDGILLHQRPHYEALGARVMTATAALHLDGGRREVETDDGQRLTADHIVIATGSRARPFPAERAQGDVLTLRSYADAVRLRSSLRPDARVAIIGGGFIGAEVASSICAVGARATIVDMDPLPFERILGKEVALRIRGLHEAAGVSQICGATVESVEQGGGGEFELALSSGTRIKADTVVAGLGNLPNVEWLSGSGLAIHNGIPCDDAGRTGIGGIYAAGDVARWRLPDGGHGRRHEHWTAAREQARIVAHTIAGIRPDKDWSSFLPYFWSDMHGKRLQALGRTAGVDDIRLEFENPEKGSYLYEYRAGGNLVGVAGYGAAGKITKYHHQLLPAEPGSNPEKQKIVS